MTRVKCVWTSSHTVCVCVCVCQVRGDFLTHTAGCQGVACANVSVYRPPIDFDRYELVPAAALLSPGDKVCRTAAPLALGPVASPPHPARFP